MAGGLRFEVHRMPPGMREMVVGQVLERESVWAAGQWVGEMKEDPCDTCLRWEECNGVDETCPLREGG